jgi:predicted MFS family arabinose efflux permease
VAIAAFFFANGATFASWVPRLPEIRQSLGVSDTVLGLTLLGGGVGGLLMSLVSGRIVDRVGSRLATVVTAMILSALLPLVAIAPSPAVLFAALVLIGAFDGLTDVAQNAQALQLQRTVSRSIVNRMHATWSIGTLIGGVAASRAAAMGVSFTTQLVVTAVALLVLTVTASQFLLPSEPPHEHPTDGDGRRIRPARMLLAGLFGVGILSILAELPATEWSALLMVERFDLTTGAAGVGFVAVAAGAVVGRLSGDLLVDRFGAERFRRVSAAIALLGLVLATTGPVQPMTLIGLFLAGAGASALFPMSVRRASELVPGATGVAMFSSGARLGILLGPPLMGILSDATSRSVALLLVGGSAAAASAAIRLPDAPVAATPPR